MTKASTFLSLLLGGLLLAAIPVSAQFASFNPDSFGEFYVVSSPQNSTEGANHSNVGASGKFQWDSTQLFLRVIINNLAGTTGFDSNGVLTGFGFYVEPAFTGFDLLSFGVYDPVDGATSNQANLSFLPINSYELSGTTGSGSSLAMTVGAATSANVNNGHTSKGVQAATSAYFDFAFEGIDPGDFSFSGFGYSQVPQPGDDFTIAFRFQGTGAKDGDSDKFGGYVVPEPSFYGLAGIGLLGLLVLSRRKTRDSRRRQGL